MPEPDDNRDRDDRSGDDKQKSDGKSPNPLGRWPLGWVLLIGLAVVMLLVMSTGQGKAVEISEDEFFRYAADGEFKDGVITEKEDQFIAELIDGARRTDTVTEDVTRVALNQFPDAKPLIKNILIGMNDAAAEGSPPSEKFVTLQVQPKPSRSGLFLLFLVQWGPLFLIAFLIYFFIFRAMRGGGGGPGGMLGNFGRSKHKMLTKEHSSVTLSDVAGIDEAKDEVGEIIEFLKHPKKFQRLGGRGPRGVAAQRAIAAYAP